MTIHHCPKCELAFAWKTELDDHCWHDHPEFRHDYPAGVAPPPVAEPAPAGRRAEPVPGTAAARPKADGFLRWLVPRQRGEHPHLHHPPREPRTEQR